MRALHIARLLGLASDIARPLEAPAVRPAPIPRTHWTRRVPSPVLIGRAASLPPH